MQGQRPVQPDDSSLGAETFGDRGDPVILLFADPAHRTGAWPDEFCSRMAEGPRFVIRYSGRPGSGLSAPATELAADALSVLTALDTGPAHIVGTAASEQAIRLLADQHPAFVASIMLISDVQGPGPGPSGIPVLTTSTEPDVAIPAILKHTSGGGEEQEKRLITRSLVAGDPTGWFERLYRAGAAGEVEMPWGRAEPHWMLTKWAAERDLDGTGQRAIVVGCGQGADAEYIATLGFQTVAFDIAETAIRLARQRYESSAVQYHVADLLDPPGEWRRAFDLVVEIITVQALPDPPRRQAIVNVGCLVAPGGTLFVTEWVRDEHEPYPELAPWPLTRAEIEAFASDGLTPVRIDRVPSPGGSPDHRWLAEFRRPAGLSAKERAVRTAWARPSGARTSALMSACRNRDRG
jgi:SAM-dependent methyltransferase